jgi:RND superfamily putative drug exporter
MESGTQQHPSYRPRDKSLLARWSRFAARRHWSVLGGWLVALILIGALSTTLGGTFVDSFEIPGAESQRAVDLLNETFPTQAGDTAQIVVRADTSVNDPAMQTRINELVAAVTALPEVVGVVSPFDTPGAISEDGRFAYMTVQYDDQASEIERASVDQLLDLVDSSGGNGLAVEVGGQVVAASEESFGGLAELIGIIAAMIILLVAFGSVVAMGVPILTALFGLAIGMMLTVLAANFWDMSTFTLSFLAMIGIGVGIDYSLFIVTRFREGLHNGYSVEDAVVRATDTSGRAVGFAGTVVAIALLGLVAIGIPFVGALGIAAAIVVITAVLIAVGMVPAVLAVLGHKIDRLRIPGLSNGNDAGRNGIWFRWSRRVQGRPWFYAILATAMLIFLAIPFFSIRLGASDAGNNPTELNSRRAYDLLAEGFGPGFNGPLLITVEQDGGLDAALLDQLSTSLQGTTGVAAVAPAVLNESGDTAVIQVTPLTAPQDDETTQLVKRLREEVIPPVVSGTQTQAYVGGATAAFIDVGDKIADRMPYFFAIVIGLSFLVLTVVFRSIVIPIKAAAMNLLSIGAAYGIVVAVFQWGWAGDLLGVEKEGPIESFLPMMLFAILFGLAMDYEVFLLSRIHEEYLHTKNARESITVGIGMTARVIFAAALIMMAVFFSFVMEDTRVIKEFGLGLGVAILVEATLIRLLLFPAVMELLGDRAWYIPAWLDRILPRVSIEGPEEDLPELLPRPERERELVPAGGPSGIPDIARSAYDAD